jgi:hypothetical protein
LSSAPLLGIDIWQQALDRYDALAEAEVQSILPLEQQQYLSDLRVDFYLYDTLAREFELLDFWIRENPKHPAAAQVESFLKRREKFGARSKIDQQERLFLLPQKHKPDEIALIPVGATLPGRPGGFSTGPAHPEDLRRTTHPPLAESPILPAND